MLFFQTVCLESLFELGTGARLGWEESMDTLERLWLPAIHSSEVYVHNWQVGVCLTIAFDPFQKSFRKHAMVLWPVAPVKRAGTCPVNAVVCETILERQVHFQSSD